MERKMRFDIDTDNRIIIIDDFCEVITDSPVGRGWKPCSQYKVYNAAIIGDSDGYYAGSPSYALHRTWSGPAVYWWNWNLLPPYPSLYAIQHGEDGVVASYPKDLSSQMADTRNAFFSLNEVDNLVNAVEAPELPASLKSLYATTRKPSVRNALRMVSNGYLAYSFGIAPLLSDMRKVTSSLKTFKSKMNRAISQGGKEEFVSTSLTGSYSHSYSQPEVNDPLVCSLSSENPPCRTITIKGVRRHKYASANLNKLNYALSRFGVTGPATYLWERTKFSFVLDWFVDLREVTNRIDNLLTGGTKRITGVCVSEKGTSKLSWKHRDVPYAINDAYKDAVVCSQVVHRYTREIPSVEPSWFQLSGRFGKKQLSLMAALIHQSVAKR
jgi:hypothetical protein